MRGLRKLTLVICVVALVFALLSTVKVQASAEEMTTFLDSQIPGIMIQVNATTQVNSTTQTQPTENLTVVVSLETETNVSVEHFNLEVYGFLNGTIELSMLNITDTNFFMNSTSSKEYVDSIYVPNWVWGTTYGEINLSYSASLGGVVLTFPDFVSGFPMTQVENTYLEGLETQNNQLQGQINNLTTLYQNLSSSFEQLNQTYVQLYQNYTSVKGSVVDLDNTRRLTTVLAVTTIIFFVTTIYLVIRRPKESW